MMAHVRWDRICQLWNTNISNMHSVGEVAKSSAFSESR